MAGNYLDSANWGAFIQELRALSQFRATGDFNDPKALIDFVDQMEIEQQDFTSSTIEQYDEPWGEHMKKGPKLFE